VKTKRIKAVLVDTYEDARFEERRWTGEAWQLPADAESYEQMVEQMAKAPYHDYTWTVLSDREKGEYRHAVRVQLRAIGIRQPKKQKGTQ